MNTPRSISSMTKVMTALLVYDAIAERKISSDTKIPITDDARAIIPWQPCGVYVPYSDKESVYDLLSIYLIVSSSPAGTSFANYPAGSVPNFVKMRNDKAKELGIDPHYNNPNGLKPNEVTPLAQAQLVRYFIQKYPEVLDITKRASLQFNGRYFSTTNKFYKNFSWYEGKVDGFKSGTMPFAGFCFCATATRNGNRVISVVIGSSDTNTRFSDSVKVLDYAFSKYPLEYKTSDWAKDLPEQASKLGFNTAQMQGRRDFSGTEPLSRGEFCYMLMKALSIPEKQGENFFDVNPQKWYAKSVESARSYGIVNGTCKDKFEPEATLTRREMAMMIQNTLRLPDNGIPVHFTDDDEIGDYFRKAVYRMHQYKIMFGTDEGYIFPLKKADRESVTSLMIHLHNEVSNGNIKNERLIELLSNIR